MRIRRNTHHSSALAPAISALIFAVPAVAQRSEPESGGLEEVIVTAQKREERLQDVPLAVTAVSGEALATRQINDSNSLVAAIPSLTYTQGANPSNTSFRIRGVGTQLFGLGTEASVSVVVDGVVAARTAQGFSELADIERIEVLRGPQGTLFGRNATAGLINVVTARPSREFGGHFDVTVAEGDEYRVRGTMSGPISDTMRARVSAYYSDVGGYVENLATGQQENDTRNWGVRGKLEWDATDALNILVAGDYLKQEANCCVSVPISLVTPSIIAVSGAVAASPTNRQIVENTPTVSNNWQWTGSITADLDLGSAAITSITAYQKYFLENNNPGDRFNSVPYIFIPRAEANWVALDQQGGEVHLDNFSQEMRIASTDDHSLTYIAGLYYNHLDVERPFARRQVRCNQNPSGQPQLAPLAPCPAARLSFFSSQANFDLKTEQIALFGQIEPKLTEHLKAIVGLRTQYEQGSNFAQQLGPIVPGDQHAVATLSGPFPITGTKSSDDWAMTGKAGLQYEFSSDAQTYLTYTRGYKGQGYNLESATNPVNQSVVDPETVNAYELGVKFSTPYNLLTTSVALFYAKYDDLQVQANRGDPALGNVQFESVNAGSSDTRGIEIEGALLVGDGFSTSFGVTYAETNVSVDGLQCPLQLQATGAIVSADSIPYNTCVRIGATGTPFQNLKDAPLPNSPKWRATLSPRYERDIPGSPLTGFVQLNVNYQSEMNFALEQDPLTLQGDYTLVDAQIGVRGVDDRWNVMLFVKNLFDENYFTSLAHTQPMATVQNPFDVVATFNKDVDRYFGLTFGMRY